MSGCRKDFIVWGDLLHDQASRRGPVKHLWGEGLVRRAFVWYGHTSFMTVEGGKQEWRLRSTVGAGGVLLGSRTTSEIPQISANSSTLVANSQTKINKLSSSPQNAGIPSGRSAIWSIPVRQRALFLGKEDDVAGGGPNRRKLMAALLLQLPRTSVNQEASSGCALTGSPFGAGSQVFEQRLRNPPHGGGFKKDEHENVLLISIE